MRNRYGKMAMALVLVMGLLVGTAAIAAEKAKAGPQTIQGTVEKGEKLFTIKTDDGQVFNILGANLGDMVGKTVKVTGTLSKGRTTRSIVVASYEEVKE